MKITDIRTVVVYGPRRMAFGGTAITALGGMDYSESAIVFIDTDAGLTGVGEISSVFSRRGKLLAAEVDQVLAPVLVGEDPFRVTHLSAAMERALS
ncbi:MAG: hypothetical protein QGH25_09665, partial [Candidatus Latescibacteria bacterium]|nr:hypothetical protein [Candidatus Latescibacterota bacterium]